MFILSDLEDTISVHPSHFSQTPAEALSDQINVKYANKVLSDVGLCISLHSIVKCSEGKVRWGDGCLYYLVTFRLIVFRPFINEVLVGRIKSSDESGIRITLGFFDDIYVPAQLIPTPSAFDYQERAWFWLYEARTEAIEKDPLMSAQEERMYLDTGEAVRFTVEEDAFCEAEPGKPAGMEVRESAKDQRPHYSLTCSIAGQGLGLVSWWTGAQEQEPEPEPEQEQEA